MFSGLRLFRPDVPASQNFDGILLNFTSVFQRFGDKIEKKCDLKATSVLDLNFP